MGSSTAVNGNGDGAAFLTDALLTLVLLLTYASSLGGMERGLGYFAGLMAFSSQFGANSALVIGVLLANAATGGGFAIGNGSLVAVGAPMVTALVFGLFLAQVLNETLPKLTAGLNKSMMAELLGTFFFALMFFSISAGVDNGGLGPLAIGAALLTVFTCFPAAVANPAVTLAIMVKNRSYSEWMDPVLHILAQTIGAALAVVVSATIGVSAAVPAASTAAAPAVLELLFSAVLGLFFVATASKRDNITTALAYMACLAAFASSFNPALPLGAWLGGLLGFGSASLEAASVLIPVVGGVAGALAHGATSGDVNEAIGTLVLFVAVGSNPPAASITGALGLAGIVAALHTIYPSASFNPALLAADLKGGATKIGLQLVGAIAGALLAQWAGVAGGAAVSVGLNGLRPAVAEALLVAVLLKIYNAEEKARGLAYVGLLAIFGAAAGSIGNPALTLGSWVGDQLLGDGAAVNGDALVSLGSHLVAPVLGGFASAPLFKLIDGELSTLLAKVGLSGSELFGSFLLVLATASTSGSLPYILALMAVVDLVYTAEKNALLPAVSAYRAFGDKVDPLGFVKQLASQLLGALAAALLSGWLLGSPVGGVGAPSGGVSTTLVNGVFWGLLLCWAYTFAQGSTGFVVSVFAAANTFGAFNGAALLAAALLRGDVDSLTDTTWLCTLVAPLLGGVLAGRLPTLIGR